MNPAAQLEHSLRDAVNEATKQVLSPIVIIGLMDVIKGDVHTALRKAATENLKSQIVRSSILPANGAQ